MSQAEPAGLDLTALDAITEAVESGAGLPQVIRALARTLDASLAVIDSSGVTLAVAARSPAEEQSLLAAGREIETIQLRLADAVVGTLHVRSRGMQAPAIPKLLVTLIASEVQRVRAPDQASETAAAELLRGLCRRELTDREPIVRASRELGCEVESGASLIVARAHPQAPTEEGWRDRVRVIAARGARAVVNRTIGALSERPDAHGAEVLLLVPGEDDTIAARVADAVLHELQAALPGYTFALGRSRITDEPSDLPRAVSEALLAANVAEGETDPTALAFDRTGAYRLLLSSMSDNPEELRRFYAETVEPLAAYDEQYETELVRTLQTFLDADGNVAGTAQRLFTHRHTVYYRLERVRELSGLDVSSSDGREKLSLGLKAMRVLGISASTGPAREAGAGGGRVPRGKGRG